MAAGALLLPVPTMLWDWQWPLLLPYGWHKLLHVAGAVLFLGNIATGALWGAVAVASRDPAKVRFTLGVINWSDAAFTGPGVILVMYNGLAMAGALGGVGANRFTLWGLTLFYAVILAWILSVVPEQHRIHRMADDAATMPRPLRAAVLRWNIIGSVAGVLAFVVLGLMVLRP